MLGFDTSTHSTITGIYAKRLREALMRYNTGNLNEDELKAKERSEKIKSEHNAVWK